ncbi:MAG: PTS sugar transporter subunit IIA [Mariprofundaceae bacterium]|nr:PTS sugar transporter subunit IIA [Mariprofundaceae bacterium]
MMIPVEQILLNPTASSKRALLTEIVGVLPALDPDPVLELIMARERLGSTGIGHGVAIPHSRMPDLAHPVIALARHVGGVDFDAIDNRLVHIVVLLLVPDDNSSIHLELLAKLARSLQKTSFRQSIMAASDAESIAKLFQDCN